MKRIFFFILLLLHLCISCVDTSKTKELKNSVLSLLQTDEYYYHSDSLVKAKSKEALNYCKAKNWNTEICFMLDMSIHSGKKRFFIWDLKNNKTLDSGLVAHGCGKKNWGKDDTKDAAVFSNIPESYCSSLGKYKIGTRGVSTWGIKVNYLMHGMEQTNNNALKRHIVLHSWKAIPNNETYPDGVPEGWGCPAVSNNFMRKLDSVISQSKKPILLWTFK